MTIRMAKTEDAERLLEIYSYYVTETAITFEYEVPSVDEFRSRIQNTLKEFPYLVLEQDGNIRGYAYAGKFHPRAAYGWCAEMTIYLDRDAHGNGWGRALYEALEERLKEMGYLNLYACIGYPSEKDDEYLTANSAQFHGHMGYRLCGTFHRCGYKFGRWYDMIWMEKIVGEHTDQPQQITTSC